jgi:putative PIN family toxin of toxin-antitoxin system
MKIVIDTNIFISALIFSSSNSDLIIDLARSKEIDNFISLEIVDEFKRVLVTKFKYSNIEVNRFIESILNFSTFVYPQTRIKIIKNKDDDNRILECALESKSKFIITGNKKHLLKLKNYKTIKILSPAEFLQKIV